MEPKLIKTIESNQGKIYIFDNDTCLKKYATISSKEISIFEEAPQRITTEIITYFKNLNNKHICKILDHYSQNGEIEGYTMPFYNELTPNILDFSDEYITRNFTELYELIIRLSYDGIRVVDLNPNNLILTKDNIIIIDFDKYRYEKSMPLETLLDINKQALFYALEKRIEENLINKEAPISKKAITEYIASMINYPNETKQVRGIK